MTGAELQSQIDTKSRKIQRKEKHLKLNVNMSEELRLATMANLNKCKQQLQMLLLEGGTFNAIKQKSKDIADCFNFNRILLSEEDIKNRYSNKRKNARSRELEFDITIETFTILLNQTECYYTGEKFKNIDDLSIDRVDSTKGYIEGNCVACLSSINNHKEDFSLFELKAIYERLINNQTQRFKHNLNEKQVELLIKKVEAFLKRKSLEEFNPCI